MTATLGVRVETGDSRLLYPGASSSGFAEGGHYVFSCPPGSRLVVDDIELARGADGFQWSPGFYAGEVTAELLDSSGANMAVYRLDVSPTPDKLGRELFELMLRELAAFAPELLLGGEAQQTMFDQERSFAPPEVQFERLRRHAKQCSQALQRVCERPLTRLARERRPTPIHQLRRLDVQTAMAIARSPLAATITADDASASYAMNLLDAPVIEDTLDNEANRAIAWMLWCLQHRVARLVVWLDSREGRRDDSFELKRARRSQILLAFQERLRRLARSEPFRSVTRRASSSAGLTAIAAHPAYARAQRYIWFVLNDAVGSADAIESLPISPTWQVYERWCYLRVTRSMRELFPAVEWKQRQYGKRADQQRFHGRLGNTELAVWLQPRFASCDRRSRSQRHSLSGQRFPDIIVTMSGQDGFSFMVLDAKYRTGRANVLDAMTSAHLYHDGLTWCGKRPWRSMLLVPHVDSVRWLASPVFQAAYGVGAVALAPRDESDALRRLITAFARDAGIDIDDATRAERSTERGSQQNP